MDHWQYRYMEDVQSDGDSEGYVYSGLGLVSHPSAEPLYRPDDSASDVDSIPRGSANRRHQRHRYQQPDLLRSLHARLPQQQHGIDHDLIYRQRMNALPLCPHCGGMLTRFENDPQPDNDQRGRNSLPFRGHHEERNRGIIGSLRPRNRIGPSHSTSQSEEVAISSISSQLSTSSLSFVSDTTLNDETLSPCSSYSTISTIHEGRMAMDSMPLLTEANAARQLRDLSYVRKSGKENYRRVSITPQTIFHSYTDLSQQSMSLKKCVIIITYASDTSSEHETIAQYYMGRGYDTYTDVPSSVIASDPTIKEKKIMAKIKKVFQKCMYVLCLLSKEYIERIKDARSDCDPMHIRFFANLMEEEYKKKWKKKQTISSNLSRQQILQTKEHARIFKQLS